SCVGAGQELQDIRREAAKVHIAMARAHVDRMIRIVQVDPLAHTTAVPGGAREMDSDRDRDYPGATAVVGAFLPQSWITWPLAPKTGSDFGIGTFGMVCSARACASLVGRTRSYVPAFG